MKTAFIAALLLIPMVIVAQPSSWRFTTDVSGWQARAKTISVSRVAGNREGSPGGLRIQGWIGDGWNYALSEHRPMTGGQLYRLSAWVRVDKLGIGTPAPFLKCEFLAAANGSRELGQTHTGAYDSARLGAWQRISAEFRAPEGAAQFWLALEKGTGGRAEIDAFLEEIVVEPIARLSALEQYRLDPLPPSLEKVRGIHPRLYLDSARITALRQVLPTTHATMWRELRELADRAVKQGPPAYRERDSRSGDEQLWQREVGNAMPVLAMAWALSGERQYLDAACQWALASCAYPTWGLGRIDGMDLAAGHQLFGLGIVYDWCYADLGDTARRVMRDTLVKRTSAMFEAAATGKAWWHNSYLQNHLWVNICGMAVAGLALFDEEDNASRWIGLPLQKFQRTMAALGSDGASHEGAGYWEYGVEYLLKFMDLARTRLDTDLYSHDWWRNTARYAQYLALPRRSWTRNNCLVDIADCPRGHWYGPDYLLRGLAREFRDGHAQWLARQIDDAGVASPGASWLNLVWFDPALDAESPSSLSTLRCFDDLGLVSARSDWSGDESLLVFKCGPYLGRKAVREFSYDPGGGHVHPDANHFVLFGAGEWLIRDDGYRAKWTGQHNTLLVDGRGQLGEGRQWFQGAEVLAVKARPTIVRTFSTPDLDQMTGEASEAYPRNLGVQRHLRHLLFLKPDVLLVCDEVVTDKPRPLELRFHPESRNVAREGNAFVLRGAKSTLRLEPLTASLEVGVSAEDLAIEGREGERNQTMFTVRLSKQAATWRNAVALSWSGLGQPIKVVRANTEGEIWRFSVEGREVALDWKNGLARLVPAAVPVTTPSHVPPYPHSAAIDSIEWHWDTLATAAPGSDLWPVTWGPDDHKSINAHDRFNLVKATLHFPPQETNDVYFPPSESAGGWRKLDTPEDIRRLAGADPSKLNELKAWLLKSDDRDFAAVVVRRGHIVLEVERGNSAKTDARRLASVSKAVCATVLAIASEQSQRGATPRKMKFEDRAFDFIPWAQPLSDPRKAAITVRQLLNHTSGLCPEATGAPNDGAWEYILGHTGDARTARLAFDPGTGCGYSTHALAHAALVCETVTGMPYDQYAIQALFQPLGIEHWWFQYYEGAEKYGRHPSHGLGMPARDLARIAYCMLRGGRWGGRQVIPKWFVDQTAQPTHDVKTPEMRWKLNPQVFSHGWELPARHWPETGRSGEGIPADARGKPGSGGQFIAFVPSLDLVITRQTGSSGDWEFEEYLRRACATALNPAP